MAGKSDGRKLKIGLMGQRCDDEWKIGLNTDKMGPILSKFSNFWQIFVNMWGIGECEKFGTLSFDFSDK